MMEQFLQILEDSLGIKHVKIALSEEWKKSPPPEAESKSIEEFLLYVHPCTHEEFKSSG